jgi:glycosyltransferase involved in cell wall biosynthesis
VKILHVFHFARYGGIETFARNLLPELERRGHENVVLFGGEQPEADLGEGTFHHLIDLDEPWYLSTSAARRVEAFVSQLDADVACIHTPLRRGAAEPVFARFPTLFFAHNYGGLCPNGGRFYHRGSSICTLDAVPDGRCVANAFLRGCNTKRPGRLAATFALARETNRWLRLLPAVVCGSQFVADSYRRSGAPIGALHVVPYGVAAPKGQRSHDGQTVLFAGRLMAQKGADFLLRAFASVPPPARLVISGSGFELPRLRLLADRLGLASRVEFKGDFPRAPELYPEASLVVLPSLWAEPFGLVGPEAMAHGIPVVASRVGGVPEWLTDGETGFLVEPKDVDALAARINTLLGDPSLAERLGRNAREEAARRFTLKRYVDSYLTLLDECAEPAMRPAAM